MTTQICPKCGKNGFTWYIDHEVSQFTLWRCSLCGYHAEEDENGMADCPRCDAEKSSFLLRDHEGLHRWCHRCGLFSSPGENRKSLVEKYVAAFNRGDVEAVCQCFAPDGVVYGVLGWGDLSKARPIWEMLVSCFQMQLQIESIIEEGDIVAVRYTERGTFVRAFRGVEPTGKSYEAVAMEWFEIGEQGITKRWGARDSATVFRQMGIPLE